MYTTRTRTLILLTLLLGLAVTSCRTDYSSPTLCERGYPIRSAASGSYQYGSKPERFAYTVEAGMALSRLHLVFENQEGSVSWTFIDPEGEVQWEGSYFEVGKFDEARDFNTVQGEWQLEVDVQDGRGAYENCWMAR
jgi:hypothetical protein